MENLSEKELLIRIATSLEKITKESDRPTKKINVPIIIALIGLFGTIFGYFFTQNAQIDALEKQAEYDLILKAFEIGESGSERQTNLLFLSKLNLIEENRKNIEEGLKNSVITPKGDLIFLDTSNATLESYELYSLAYDLNGINHYRAAIKVAKTAIQLDPLYYHSYTALGYSYMMLNEYEHAIHAYSKATVMENSDKSLAHYNLAFCYQRLNDYSRACQEYRFALEEAKLNNNIELIHKIQNGIDRNCK